MKHVFKKGGDWTTESGFSYTVKSVNDSELSDATQSGWSLSLNEIEETKKTTRKSRTKKAE